MDLVDMVFLPFLLFMFLPYLAFAPAIFFGIKYFRTKRKIIIGITALLWLVYGLYELYFIPRECSLNCIRVDLLLIVPVLTLCTIFALGSHEVKKRNMGKKVALRKK